jgi:hypothetical protein
MIPCEKRHYIISVNICQASLDFNKKQMSRLVPSRSQWSVETPCFLSKGVESTSPLTQRNIQSKSEHVLMQKNLAEPVPCSLAPLPQFLLGFPTFSMSYIESLQLSPQNALSLHLKVTHLRGMSTIGKFSDRQGRHHWKHNCSIYAWNILYVLLLLDILCP